MRETISSSVQAKALSLIVHFLQKWRNGPNYYTVTVPGMIAVSEKSLVNPKAVLGFWKEAATWYVAEGNFHFIFIEMRRDSSISRLKTIHKLKTFWLSETRGHESHQKFIELIKLKIFSRQTWNWLNTTIDWLTRKNSTCQIKFADCFKFVWLCF